MSARFGTISASIMEEIRIFERRRLRACLGLYRSIHSNYKRHINNETIYNKANINRIDNFIIKTIQIYFANTKHVTSNSLIFSITHPDDNYIRETLMSGFIPPEAFVHLNKLGYIQRRNGVPILYDISRHRGKKSITYALQGHDQII